MMLWKCCTQYASKSGKPSSGHRTGKVRLFSIPNKGNVHTTAQLYSSLMLAKLCSKFSKPCFNSTGTVNFQMSELDLEKAEEPEIKLSTSARSLKKQENSGKTSTSALLTTPKPLTVWKTGKFFKRWESQSTWSASWEMCRQVKKQ